MSQTQISADKIRAYEATDYRLGHTKDDIILNIGKASPRLIELFKQNNLSCGAFLTAYNPRGTRQSDAANDLAHAKLAKDLTELRVHFIEGSGSEEGTEFPGERSFFVLGLTLETASKIGKDADQDAIVWVGADAIPQLILLR